MELTEREWEIVRRALRDYLGTPGDTYASILVNMGEITEARNLYHRLTAIPVR